ncbi:MAG: lytic transglycosylase domain-containing protein [Pyrinomonadaceae bacterium]
MKRSHLIILVSLLAGIPAMSQERPRYFDNFDTLRGVSVVKPAYIPVAATIQAKSTKVSSRLNNTKKYVKPTAISAPTKSTRTARMDVSEGLADREMLNSALNSTGGRFSMASNAGMKGFTTGNVVFDSYIVDSSRRYGIDPLLIYAQMHQESSFKLKALSNKGASGLMQLMPATARRLGVTNIYDPKQNIDGGVKYMRMLLDMFNGDVTLALAGYNAGEGAVMKYGYNVPPYNETREYVRRISARYASISDGTFARNYKQVNSKTQEAKLEKKESRPLTVYEPNAMAIRMADGRMRLVNQ